MGGWERVPAKRGDARIEARVGTYPFHVCRKPASPFIKLNQGLFGKFCPLALAQCQWQNIYMYDDYDQVITNHATNGTVGTVPWPTSVQGFSSQTVVAFFI